MQEVRASTAPLDQEKGVWPRASTCARRNRGRMAPSMVRRVERHQDEILPVTRCDAQAGPIELLSRLLRGRAIGEESQHCGSAPYDLPPVRVDRHHV